MVVIAVTSIFSFKNSIAQNNKKLKAGLFDYANKGVCSGLFRREFVLDAMPQWDYRASLQTCLLA
ncbi:hypothetical protein NHP200010_15160 [Helicobacter bizzozeronii]|nr:hypothetical protein NHP200010_15160 [Helicobacter bizzozeronii]